MVREEFIDAVRTGSEIEFTCEGKSYFESHEADDLINNALINGSSLSKMWYKIKIDYIL